jgi:protein SCO1
MRTSGMRARPHGPLLALAVAVLLLAVSCAGGSARTARPSPTPTPAQGGATSSPAALVSTPGPTAADASATTQAIPSPSGGHAGPEAHAALPGPSVDEGASDGGPGAALTGLVAAGGEPFALADTDGHWRLVFFGYTHCPDVCPETIGVLMQVLMARPETRVIFVSIDPARDTPASLGTWTRYLPEGLVGVTGSPTAVRHAADGFGVTYARVDTGSKAGYSMAHTADQFLIDPEGQLRLTYPFGTTVETILADIGRLDSADQETT